MVHDPKALQAILAECVPDQELVFKPMFGGILAYHAGRPLASLSDRGLALKFNGADHAAALAVPGADRLRYEPDSPLSKTYVVLPHDGGLRPWVLRAIESLPPKKPKK